MFVYFFGHIVILLHESFSHQRWLMDFPWSLSDCKSPQVSTTHSSILADLNNAEVWIVSTRPPISKSSSPCTNPLVTVTRTPITTGTTVTFMFHSFFNSLVRSSYLSFFSLSFSKVHNFANSLVVIVIVIVVVVVVVIRSGRLAEIRRSVCISKFQRSLCFILQDRFWVEHIPFVRMVKFQFLALF